MLNGLHWVEPGTETSEGEAAIWRAGLESYVRECVLGLCNRLYL